MSKKSYHTIDNLSWDNLIKAKEEELRKGIQDII
jgi:hypothetical protein